MRIALLCLVLLWTGNATAAARIAVVAGNASGHYARLVEKSLDGDTLFFKSGEYEVSHLYITKRLTLLGEDGTVFNGKGQPILFVATDSVVVAGIVFKNVHTSYVADHSALRFIKCSGGRVDNCRFQDTFFGVYLEKAGSTRITRNRFQSVSTTEAASGNAIHLWYSTDNTISDNYIEGFRDGIYLEFAGATAVLRNVSHSNLRYGLHFMFSHDNTYVGNTFENNGAGVAVMYSTNVLMSDNRFINNWGPTAYGLLLKDLKDSRLEKNLFKGNSIAVHADNLERMTIRDNKFVENGWALRMRSNCRLNTFTHNDFLGNTFDVSSPTSQTENTFEQNYWSHYRGYDLDRDGIGDIPFRPVSLFSYLAVENSATLLLLRSFVMDLLDMAEQIFPTLTPSNLSDNKPLMRPVNGRDF